MEVFSLDIISLILVITIFQGAIMTVAIIRKGGNHNSNKLLAAVILVLLWYQIEFLLVREVIDWKFNVFYGTRYGSWTLLGPLFYFYVLSFDNNHKFQFRHLLYFMPFLLFSIAIPLLFQDAIPERGKFYGMLTVLKLHQMGLSGLQSIYGILFFLQFLYAAFFVGLAYQKTIKLKSIIKNNFSSTHLDWLRRITIIIFVILVFAVLFLIVLFYSSQYARWMDHIYVLPITLTVYWISYYIIKHREVLEIQIAALKNADKYEKSSLTGTKADEIFRKLEVALKQDKVFLDPSISLNNLAQKLSASPHHLSQVINDKMGTSFYNLINEYRIEEAKHLFKTNDGKKTILEIAFEVGFNNKVSFNNYFKKHTGMTPKNFMKSIR